MNDAVAHGPRYATFQTLKNGVQGVGVVSIRQRLGKAFTGAVFTFQAGVAAA